MTEDSVIDNMITFLIAGHETTSGLLSFAFYYMLKNPNAYKKAQEEVDEAIGKGPITVEHLNKLPYLNAVSHFDRFENSGSQIQGTTGSSATLANRACYWTHGQGRHRAWRQIQDREGNTHHRSIPQNPP